MRTVLLANNRLGERVARHLAERGDLNLVVHLGGIPVCLLGSESKSVQRRGFPPTDGPDAYTAGTPTNQDVTVTLASDVTIDPDSYNLSDKADAYRHEQQSHAVYAVIVRNADEDAAHCHRRHLGQVKTAQQHRHRHACRNNTGGRHINADVFEVCRREEIR